MNVDIYKSGTKKIGLEDHFFSVLSSKWVGSTWGNFFLFDLKSSKTKFSLSTLNFI